VIDQALEWVIGAAVASVVVAAAFGALLTATAAWHALLHRRHRHGPIRSTHGVPPTPLPVSVIVVEREDDPGVADRLEGLLALDYHAFEVIVVCDGPIGAHLARALTRFHATPADLIYRPAIPTARVAACYHGSTTPTLVVLEKERTTAADALNAGINAARSPYVCVVGPRAMLERAALARLMAPVMEDPDRVVATAGIERVLNGCGVAGGEVAAIACPSRAAVVWAVFDGLRAALAATGLSPLAGLVPRPGGCLLAQKRAILRVGGFEAGGAEPTDILFRIRRGLAGERLPRRTVFVPEPVAWSPVPDTLAGAADAYRARVRDTLGCLAGQACRTRMSIREIGWALVVLARGLGLAGPVVDVGGAALVTAAFLAGEADSTALLVVWMCVLAARTAVSSAAILFHDATLKRYPAWQDVGRLFVAAVVEPVVFRPLTAVWTVQAGWNALRAMRTRPANPATASSSAARQPA
jgi:hypothetical protein